MRLWVCSTAAYKIGRDGTHLYFQHSGGREGQEAQKFKVTQQMRGYCGISMNTWDSLKKKKFHVYNASTHVETGGLSWVQDSESETSLQNSVRPCLQIKFRAQQQMWSYMDQVNIFKATFQTNAFTSSVVGRTGLLTILSRFSVFKFC